MEGISTETGQITDHLALRAFTPYWSTLGRADFPLSYHPRGRSYDTVIIGAGVCGALMAEALSDGKKSMLIIDRRMPIAGSTLASTALIQHELDTPLFKMANELGSERAERVWHRSATAVERLISMIGRLGLDCGLQRKKTLYLAGEDMDAEAMATESQARNLTGLRSQYLSHDCLISQFGIDRPAALLSSMSASINPVQLTAGLLREVCHRGAEIVGQTEIIDVRRSGGRIHLLTSEGDFISAGHVIFCTGYEFPEALVNPTHTIASTWAITTRPGLNIPRWLDQHILWEASDPYLYIRTTSDGRIMAGGEDEDDVHAFHSPEKHEHKSHIIAEKLSSLLGIDVGEPAFRWSGAFGKTPMGLPYIGEIPDMPQVYAVMGFGGNGMTFGQIAADLLKAEIGGRRDPDAELFSFPSPTPDRLQA